MTELRRPAPLDPRGHDRERFGSGEAALDEWVIADADHLVAAYASVAMTGIDRSAAP